jgi:hypothetical protein
MAPNPNELTLDNSAITLLADYVMAQVTAGLMELPSFLCAPVQAGSR